MTSIEVLNGFEAEGDFDRSHDVGTVVFAPGDLGFELGGRLLAKERTAMIHGRTDHIGTVLDDFTGSHHTTNRVEEGDAVGENRSEPVVEVT